MSSSSTPTNPSRSTRTSSPASPRCASPRRCSTDLTKLDPHNAAPIPALAERWEISPDGRIYTFHLRTNAVWSTGEPITSDDVVWSWFRALSPATAGDYAGQLFYIKGAEDWYNGKIKERSPGRHSRTGRPHRAGGTELAARVLSRTLFVPHAGRRAASGHREIRRPLVARAAAARRAARSRSARGASTTRFGCCAIRATGTRRTPPRKSLTCCPSVRPTPRSIFTKPAWPTSSGTRTSCPPNSWTC